MIDITVQRETTAPPELVLDTLRDPSADTRSEIWSNVTPKHFTLHESGPAHMEVTEGTIVVGLFWERSRYDWSQPDVLTATVLESNVFKPGSLMELRATPQDGGSLVEMRLRREFRRGPKGLVAAAVNHAGGRRLFGWYLGTALKALEKRISGASDPGTTRAPRR